MKWPFVRTSFHDNIVSQLIDREIRLGEENNRLNQELASELNSHRETKKQLDFERDYAKKVEKELHGTKDALKIAQEDNEKTKKLNDKWEEAIKKFALEINISKTDCW